MMVHARRANRFVPPVAVERLESRSLLAGNVTAGINPSTGMLDIFGDGKSNQIRIERTTELRIIGVNGTKINGAPSAVVPEGNFNIRLGNGDDAIEFAAVGVTHSSLALDTGKGDDRVSILNWSFDSAVTIDTGAGKDTVVLGPMLLSNELTVRLSKGKDRLSLIDTIINFNSATFDGGRGRDVLTGIASMAGPGATVSIQFEVIS